jgi:stearoyl-CoA desaturase (delta-9 desaturase)
LEPITLTPRQRRAVNWTTTIALIVFHAGAIAALFHFSWTNLIVCAVLYWATLSFGIGMGYHRLLTHRGYKVPLWLERTLAVFGTLTLEGGPIFWVATHRIHHQKSDQPGDPHSPHDGAWWAHIGWIMFGQAMHNEVEALGKYAPDVARDPFMMWLSKWHWVPLTVLGLALLPIGGWPLVYWAVFMRVTLGLHGTWLVNSATHMWGSKRFKTRDDSRNNWWVALLTFGEGWHNNHHAHPVSARHGLAWYELDITWMTIKLLEKLGIAKMVKEASVEGMPAPKKQAA